MLPNFLFYKVCLYVKTYFENSEKLMCKLPVLKSKFQEIHNTKKSFFDRL